jgi:hypothetical protein
MSENIQKSPSLNQMVDAFTHLKQWLETLKDIFRILKIKR